jgi:hypothetical protein
MPDMLACEGTTAYLHESQKITRMRSQPEWKAVELETRNIIVLSLP